jgi:hypothetical protein
MQNGMPLDFRQPVFVYIWNRRASGSLLKDEAQKEVQQKPQRYAQTRGIDDADPKRFPDDRAVHIGHLRKVWVCTVIIRQGVQV